MTPFAEKPKFGAKKFKDVLTDTPQALKPVFTICDCFIQVDFEFNLRIGIQFLLQFFCTNFHLLGIFAALG